MTGAVTVPVPVTGVDTGEILVPDDGAVTVPVQVTGAVAGESPVTGLRLRHGSAIESKQERNPQTRAATVCLGGTH